MIATHRQIPIIALALLTMSGAACNERHSPQAPDGVCTAQFVYGLTVTVRDRVSGQRICDAQVNGSSGSFHETLEPRGPAESCTYAGAGERRGTYDLTASKSGYISAMQTGIRVDADQCHVIPVPVTLELVR
jgi:hypothetical protein